MVTLMDSVTANGNSLDRITMNSGFGIETIFETTNKLEVVMHAQQ